MTTAWFSLARPCMALWFVCLCFCVCICMCTCVCKGEIEREREREREGERQAGWLGGGCSWPGQGARTDRLDQGHSYCVCVLVRWLVCLHVFLYVCVCVCLYTCPLVHPSPAEDVASFLSIFFTVLSLCS